MPSFTATPARLVITGGAATFIPARFSATPARIRVVGGTAGFTIGDGQSLSAATPKLDRAQRQLPIGEVRNGMVYLTVQEQNRQQKILEAVEAAFAAIDTRDDNQDSVLAKLDAAYNLATAANDSVAQVEARINISASYPNPPGVLTASSDGQITIAAHDRAYADGTSVSVNAGSVGGFAPGESVTVYYVDAARAGGAVTYQGSAAPVAQTGNTHVIGAVLIPAVGEVPAAGSGVPAPGYISPEQAEAYELYNPVT